MVAKLQVDVTVADQHANAVLTGKMDANADYSVIPLLGVRTLTLDFSGISLIDSVGIQNWLRFATAIPAAIDVEYLNCTVRVISQINLFQGFTGNRPVRIRTFFAPYYCEACDESRDYVIDTEAAGLTRDHLKAPPKTCTACNAPLEFDGIEKKYFQFLTY